MNKLGTIRTPLARHISQSLEGKLADPQFPGDAQLYLRRQLQAALLVHEVGTVSDSRYINNVERESFCFVLLALDLGDVRALARSLRWVAVQNLAHARR